MLFLWIFTIFWCSISFTMMVVVVRGPAPWYAVAFVSIFVLIGAGLLYWLLATHYQRWRTGRVRLTVTPDTLPAGDDVTLRFDVERDDFAGRTVQFTLELQESDDGWSTRDTLHATGVIHAALRQTTTKITLPDGARASGNNWRWLASAHLHGMPYSNAECVVFVQPSEQALGPSKETVTLTTVTATDSSAAFGERTRGAIHTVAAPDGVREVSPGVWQWHQSSTALRVIGALLLVFAWFWLRGTGDFGLIRTLMSSHGWSWASIGMMLFSLPFVVGGLLLLMLSLALLTHRLGATVRRGEITVTTAAFGMRWNSFTLRARDIQRLQATASMSSGPTVLRYGLAARTANGAVRLPFTAREIDGAPQSLMQQARWLAGAMGISEIQFDPDTMASDVPLARNASQEETRAHLGKLIGRAIGVAFALGMIGFALIFVWSLWSARR